MSRNMILVLLFVAMIGIAMFLGNMSPLLIQQGLYSISLTVKSIIIALLPFIIFGLLFKASVTLASNATKIIGLILLLVCCSNLLSTFLSHYFGVWVYNFDLEIILPKEETGLKPLWMIDLPVLIANDKAMFAGIILGIISARVYPEKAIKIAAIFELIVNKVLRSFTYIVPLFIAGFIAKLHYDDVIGVIIKDYASILIIIALAQFGYIFLAYLLFNGPRKFITSIKNMMPAAITGFTAMSSAVSMPLTIIGVEKNAENKDLARSVVPATVNIHLIGDCFAIPILAYAMLKSFGIAEPSLMNYMIFAFYFVLAKFSVAAIPGGGIIVMLPILEAYLGFTVEMMSLITALYILFDSVITCANVFGNGVFAKMIEKVLSLIDRTFKA
jgi:Na+/H+-dicarboxylate symporter